MARSVYFYIYTRFVIIIIFLTNIIPQYYCYTFTTFVSPVERSLYSFTCSVGPFATVTSLRSFGLLCLSTWSDLRHCSTSLRSKFA